MNLHTTASEEEMNAQAARAVFEHQRSPRTTNPNHLSVSSYVASMTGKACPDDAQSRCPTSKECGKMIMKLKMEVWDLKCRLATEKTVKASTSAASGGVKGLREFESWKDNQEITERKIQDLENMNRFLQENLRASQQREEILQQQNKDFVHKLDILDHELALANLRKTELDGLNTSFMTFQLDEDFPSLSSFVSLPDQNQHPPVGELQQKQVPESEDEVRKWRKKLDIATEDVTVKSQLIESLELLLKEKNALMAHGDQETSKLKDKIIQMTQALKEMGFRHADEQTLHNSLKSRYRELLEEYEGVRSALEQMKRDFEAMGSHRDPRTDEDVSHDLGIEMTTMENVLKPAKDNSADEKIRCLKARNRELVTKLRQTKLALDKTLERLSKTAEEKDQVEKAVCRQLHWTHQILRAARKNLENPSEPTPPAPLQEID